MPVTTFGGIQSEASTFSEVSDLFGTFDDAQANRRYGVADTTTVSATLQVDGRARQGDAAEFTVNVNAALTGSKSTTGSIASDVEVRLETTPFASILKTVEISTLLSGSKLGFGATARQVHIQLDHAGRKRIANSIGHANIVSLSLPSGIKHSSSIVEFANEVVLSLSGERTAIGQVVSKIEVGVDIWVLNNVLVMPVREGPRSRHWFWSRVPSVPVGVDVAVINGSAVLGPFTQKQVRNADHYWRGVRRDYVIGSSPDLLKLLSDTFDIEQRSVLQ